MQHTLCDNLIEDGMGNRIRELSRDDLVHMQGVVYFVLMSKEYEKMKMWETSLLKFDGIDHASDLAEETISNIFEQRLHLLEEDLNDNVRMISSCLMPLRTIRIIILTIELQQGLLNFRPIWICSHSEKQIWFLTVPCDSHRVLKELVHVTGTARVGGWKNDAGTLLAQIDRFIILTSNSISQTLVQISPDVLLMCSEPIKFTAFNRGPGINNILLEEMTPTKDSLWIIWPWMEMIGIVVSLSDILGTNLVFRTWKGRDLRVPTLFTIGKEKNVVQGEIERIKMTDSLQTTTLSRSLQMKNDFSMLVNLLLTISRNYSSDFVDSRQVVMARICCRLQDNAGLNIGFVVW